MAETDKKSDQGEGCFVVLIIAVSLIGMVLFGDWFAAPKNILSQTSKAQRRLSESINNYFMEYGRIEVKTDYTVIIYITKDNYEYIPYPDRKAVVEIIGETWLDDPSVKMLHLPKVQLRDIKTGEVLATYRSYGLCTIK